jgi:SAM-dependent methyltransferase
MNLEHIQKDAAYNIGDGKPGSPITVGWGLHGKEDQELRYKLLLQIWEPGMSILEPGCGYGALLDHCDVGLAQYAGFDLVPDLVQAAKDLHPGYRFEQGAPDFGREQADVILCSGVVSYLGGEDEVTARSNWIRWLKRAWACCRVGLAFNGAREDEVHPVSGGVRWPHLQMPGVGRSFGGVESVTLITEAMPCEFTLLVRKRPASS